MENKFSAEEKLRQKTKQLYQEAQEKEARQLAEKLEMAYLDGNLAKVSLDAMRLIDQEQAKTRQMVPIQLKDNKLTIVCAYKPSPEDRDFLAPLRKSYEIEFFIVSKQALASIIRKYEEIPAEKEIVGQDLDIPADLIEKYQRQLTTISALRKKLEEIQAKRKTSQALEIIFAGALAIDASDVHIEPKEEKADLKFRIDGVLQEITTFNIRTFELITNRLKLLSGMKLNIKDAPQDGRFSIKTTAQEIEIRSSALPGPNGENIVMRVLNPKTIALTLEKLGLMPFEEELIKKELSRPNGLFLVTGPTGSGKTTTLYAFLKKVNEEPGLKIITIEDPIEYHLQTIEQTQVEPKRGYTFDTGLRSILRQDPDIILVGEMRDLDTVQTALHAALTGHLVFSTLHTNDAAGIIPRLIDMGAQSQIIAPAINIGLAQRLIRKVCPNCSKKEPAGAKLAQKLREIISQMPEVYLKRPEIKESTLVAKAVGCDLCNNTGYKGRIAVFEIFIVDNDVEKLIMTKPSDTEVKQVIRKKGMITLKENGALKVIQGITTLEEVERVVG